MVYVCDSCRFVFERTGETDACPDCGKPDIREASEAERDEYRKGRADFGKGGHGGAKG
ncbi:MAG: hypothetical protein LBP73_10685 [Clostridiales Family XIII bacterium]|jgi:rRNA maturation endonuclease Nob1|nr:hypothetical protein [Clostridiales Family XIII bacterium]